MEVLVPTIITPAMVASVTANGVTLPEDPSQVWTAKTYADLELAHVVASHRVYRKVGAGASTVSPDINITGWQDFGPTNRTAAFDQQVSSQTRGASPLVFKIQPGAFNAFALFGVDATSVTIDIKETPGGTSVPGYPRTAALDGANIGDWYDYFFAPFVPVTDYYEADLPAYYSSEITITLSQATGTAAVGAIVVGDQRSLGQTLKGAQAKLTDFSYVNINQYGDNVIIRGKSARDMEASTFISLMDANAAEQTLASVLGRPCVFIASRGAMYSPLRVFGLGKGSLGFDYAEHVKLSLSVQGLT